jgi:ferredoxin
VRLSIDHERCTGHGRCYTLAPEVFGADDAGYAVLLVGGDVPAELEEKARSGQLSEAERAIDVLD